MNKFFKHPWLIVVVIAIITVFFASWLPKAELDNNNLRFVPDSDPALNTSRWIDSSFGSSFFILVGLEREYGTVFEPDFLNRIRDYVNRIEEIPIVKDVTSLMNTDYITSRDDAIVVEKLVGEDFSGTPEEIAELKRRLLSWDMYQRSLISDDFSATQILVPLSIKSEEAGLPEVTASFLQVRNFAWEMFGDLATVYVTGMPVISATINEAINADLKLLVPLVILVVLTVLFFSFRGFTPVVLPLLTVLIAVIWSVGAMPIVGIKLSVITTVLPVILVAVGSAYGIHVVTHYITDRGGAELGREEHRELVFEVLRKIRKPVFLAALTTFAAFCSFCFTSVVPVREFGYFSSFGVVVSFIVAMTLIPALLIIRGPKKMKSRNSADSGDRLSGVIADNLAILAGRRKTILFFTVLVMLFSVYGLSKVIIDNIMVEYFKPDTDIYKSDVFIREKFGGSKVISVVLEADSTELLLHPDTLAAMDSLASYLQHKVPNVGKVMGFTDLVKRINQVFNADESPDGIKSAPQSMPLAPSGYTSSGFGFAEDGDDFGFGFADGDDSPGFANFGFDAADDAAIDTVSGAEKSGGAGDDGEKIYTQSELLALFDRAGNQSRDMNANDLIWELKRQVNYEGTSYYEIPVDPKRYGKESPQELQRLISNYLVLLAGSIDNYANDPLEPTAVKSTVQLRTLGMYDSGKIFSAIDQYTRANIPSGVKVIVGGTTMVEQSINDLVVQSQLISVLVSIICVFIILAVSNRSLAAGCIGIAPLSISVLINFAVMGFAGIKLNIGTSMVASVSVGVGIDYTIHCMEAYKREYRISGGGDFLRRTFLSSGKAIIINAVSVGAGFAVLLFSRFNMLGDLGLLIAITMFSSALISLTVLPALLILLKPKFITGE
ncbi:antibiotic transporter [Spirochaetia bacterium]|nr:antibiotic transporter [Spirochaetia bacterium]